MQDLTNAVMAFFRENIPGWGLWLKAGPPALAWAWGCMLVFGNAALFGYLVTGLGDAIAEPVGTRWGRHRYRVPALRGVHATRSLEGSAAVFAASALGIAVAARVLGGAVFTPGWIPCVLALAAVCTVLEAVSPHGWDNAVLQLAPAWLASSWWMGGAA